MDKAKMRAVAEAIGIVAVVASLGFLGLEVKQGNDIAQANMRYDLLMAHNEFHDLVLVESEVAALLSRLGDADAEFSDTETERVRALANRMFNQWNAIHGAYITGQIPQSVYDNLSGTVPRVMSLYPAAIPFWVELLAAYPGVQDYPIQSPLVEHLGLR